MPDGSCVCGAIKFSYSGEPAMKAICHCLTCRKLSSSTYSTTMLIPDPQFRLVSGTPKTYTVVHESGMPLTYSFCGDCAAVLFKTAPGWPGCKIAFGGALDGDGDLEAVKPDAELFTGHRVSWVPSLEEHGIKQFKAFPEG